MDCKRDIVIIEVVVKKNANTTQHYNEVEQEKEATVKEYLTVHKDVIRDSCPLFSKKVCLLGDNSLYLHTKWILRTKRP